LARKEPPSPTPRPRTIGSAIGGGKQTGPGARTGSAEPTLGARFLHVSIVTDAPYLIRRLSGLPSHTVSAPSIRSVPKRGGDAT
jgi:hypothetical protein